MNWLHSGRAYHESWCTIQHSSEKGSSPSFPWARQEEELPASLPGPTPSLLCLCGFMWWSAWKWSQGTVVPRKALPRNRERPIPKLHTLLSQGRALPLYKASHATMNPRITPSHHDPISPVGRWIRPQRQTFLQNWTKHFSAIKESRTPKIK